MCLNPIKLYNPARKISLYGGQRYQIELPCGQCAECREAKRTDIYFRSYYECLDTFRKNGYVYFDTLTYSTPNLPHISDFIEVSNPSLDFTCFNPEHFRMFMVRLRRQLEYHGFNCKENLKYFVSSEYGSDKEYTDDSGKVRKATNRPHYHVLFFVTGDIDPLVFSSYVNKCWQLGKTDGIDYHDANYVYDHVYGPKYNSDDVHMRAVCNYVAKYVLKDSNFEDSLKKRIQQIMDMKDETFETYQGRKMYNTIVKPMRPYCRWSNGFGSYGLEYNDEDLVFENKMRIPDKDEVWRFAPLSSYLNRKKYYEAVRDSEGKLYWQLTEAGKDRAFVRAVKGAEQFAERFDEWLNNIDTLMTKDDKKLDYDWDNKQWFYKDVTSQDIFYFRRNLIDNVKKYLGDRSSLEFAVYVQFYKGRVKSMEQRNREKKGIYRVDDVDRFFKRSLISKIEIDDLPSWLMRYNYAHCSDNRHFGRRIIGDTKLDSVLDGVKSYAYIGEFGYDQRSDVYKGDVLDVLRRSSMRFESCEDFAREWVIDENSDPRFKDFDKLYNLYATSLQYRNKRKQDTYDYIEDLKRRYKDNYIRTI